MGETNLLGENLSTFGQSSNMINLGGMQDSTKWKLNILRFKEQPKAKKNKENAFLIPTSNEQ